jgi:hypothetical protein
MNFHRVSSGFFILTTSKYTDQLLSFQKNANHHILDLEKCPTSQICSNDNQSRKLYYGDFVFGKNH